VDMDDDVERESFHIIPFRLDLFEAWQFDRIDKANLIGDYISDYTDCLVFDWKHIKLIETSTSLALFADEIEREWNHLYSEAGHRLNELMSMRRKHQFQEAA